jgi:AcrR family transcriptional regulator
MTRTTSRKSAEERREQILEAAMIEFAEKGLHGTSTDDIARRVGVSQPYLFRLFGTKKELYIATIARCFRQVLEMFQRAAEGKRGEEALHAIGEAYMAEFVSDRVRLKGQMQAYNACDDPEIRDVVRNGFGDLVTYAERVSGLPPAVISAFIAQGMLLNVTAALQLQDSAEPWAQRLIEGCKEDLG